jgi:hypothetical protein
MKNLRLKIVVFLLAVNIGSFTFSFISGMIGGFQEETVQQTNEQQTHQNNQLLFRRLTDGTK